MWRSIRLLTRLSLCNFLGFNEARYSKNSAKRSRLITSAVAVVILGAMMIFYAGLLTLAFIEMNFTEMIPMYLGTVIGLLSFVFTVFRAGPALFSQKQYERLAVLPVKPAAIVISRFISLYVTELSVSVCSTAAVLVVCACKLSLSPWFYISMAFGSLVLPLLPMTASMIVGTVIYALTASMKRKNTFQIIFSFAFLALYFTFVNSMNDVTDEMILDLAEKIRSFGRIYPPVSLFADGVWGNIGAYLLFLAVSVGIFLGVAFIVGRYYGSICTRLTANAAKRNYVMRSQKGRSALAACFFRERKRYFASATYVMNTAVGYIMTVVFVCVLVFGETRVLFSQLPSDVVAKLAPFCIAALANALPTTASAISMEGKHFWLTQTLPVRMRDIAGAKILLGLMLSVPCTLISSVIVAIAIRPNMPDLFWMIFVSLLYAVFGCVLGLFVNLKLPMLHWDQESQPVKQSKAVLVMMLVGFATAAAPAVLLLVFRGIAAHIAIAAICFAVILLTRAIYRKICAFDLKTIAED